MRDEDLYYVPVNVEDGPLRDLVERATAVLKLNDRLEKIFQNFHKTYNDTYKKRVSVKALQVMNENYKPIFTSLTPSGVIRSPLCSSINSKTNPNKQLQTPLKMKKRICFHPERKRLFNDPEKENIKQPHETLQACNNSQLLVTNYAKKNSPRTRSTINEEKAYRNLVVKPAIFNYREDTKCSDSSYMFMQERFSLDGKPETITSLSVYDPDIKGSLNESPGEHQNMATIADRKSSPPLSYEIGGKRDKCEEMRLPLFSSCKETKNSDSPDIPAQNRLCLGEKAKTTSRVYNDIPLLSTEYFKKHQTGVTRCEKKTPVKNHVFDRKSTNHEETSPSPSISDGKTKIYSETKPNEEYISCSDLMLENAPKLVYEQKEYQSPETTYSMSNEHKVALFATYTTPEKYKTMFSKDDKGERPPFTTPIVIKNVVLKTDSNEQVILNPKIDMKTLDSSKVNKRKSVDDSDETFINGYLIGENQDHVGAPKIAKLDNPLAMSEKNNIDSFVVDGKIILNTPANLNIDDKIFLNPIDSSTNTEIFSNPVNFIKNDNVSFIVDNFVINDKISSIPVDSVTNDEVSSNLDNDSIMDDEVSFNHVDILTMDDKVSCTNVNSVIENTSNPVNSVTNDGNSPNPAPDCTMEDEVSLNCVDDSTIEYKIRFTTVNSSTDSKISSNPADSVINDEVSSNLDDDSIMDDEVSFNHVDDSTIEDKMPFTTVNSSTDNTMSSNPADSVINDEVSSNLDDDSIMDDEVSVSHVDDSTIEDKMPFTTVNSSTDNTMSSNPVDSSMNDEVSSNLDDDSTMNDAVSFSHVDDSTMDKKIFSSPSNYNVNGISFNHIDDCAMNDKISYRPDSSITDDKIPYSPSNTICDISVDDEISFIHDNTPNESFNRNDDKFSTDFHTTKSPNPAEKSERAKKAAVHYETQNCSPKSDQNITMEDNLDISKSRKDKTRINGTVTDDTTDVESLTRQMKKLSPSVKRSVDGNTKAFKLITDSVGLLRLQDNVLKTEPPPKDCITPKVLSSKKFTTIITKMEKFGEKFHQGFSRLSLYHHLFYKDERDLRFVCAYLKIITDIVETIPLKVRGKNEAELEKFAYFFTNKTSKLLMKITLWRMEAENNVEVVKDCVKRLTGVENEMEEMVKDETQKITANHLVKWESCMKVTNKKLDDMLLLRDIKRPTLLEFGYELENLIQIFIRCLFLVGIIKPTSKICSD